MLRRQKRKRAAETAVAENDEWATCAYLIDDTMASIQLLRNQHCDSFAALGLPPLVLWHQLPECNTCILILPIDVRIIFRYITQVHRLRKSGKLITFRIPSGADDMVILRIEDYITEVEKYEAAYRARYPKYKTISSNLNAMATFRQVLPKLASLSTIPLQVLVSKMSETESCLDEQKSRAFVGYVIALSCKLHFETDEQIQRLGFLLPTTRLDNESYCFSIPGMGKFVSAIRKTRTQIQNTLKLTKYKEMLEQQLKKIKLKHSRFKLEFHLADMEGCGLIQPKKVTSGVLIALTK
ncbi:hypothetical protein PsorP6_009648 [Peronosclerospora sorghi]|uniref:Uncharacterized protein n=1 Tax=Peronosclerospora sorghi TaxID=230839 RepID=A0ACC0W0I6_9STRA|nr:hypothetical protein PsorP6_009648 [Peronosclerospora sorghi]